MNYRDDVEILLYAVEEGDIDIVQFLLENGANLQNSVGNTALIQASEHGYFDILRYLLEYGTDPNMRKIYTEVWR